MRLTISIGVYIPFSLNSIYDAPRRISVLESVYAANRGYEGTE
nr:MAG TPA: hypothetical protein [Caudoviricetes sp.]